MTPAIFIITSLLVVLFLVLRIVYLVSVIERFQADAAIDKAFRAKQGKRISDLLAINAKLNSNISQLKEEKLEAINEKEELEIDLVNSISIINNKINA